ncbi:MAG: type VI secretion system contractile sheath domain-containing protein [Planctomycetota bacterium]|jgi:type VI secretion system protein ImpC
MSEGVSLGNVDFELSTLASFALRKAKDNVPFCMAVLADFTGRGNSGLRETGPPLAARRRILVDVDNLDELPGKLGCGLHIPLMGKDDLLFSIAFRELSDFHPDQIIEQVGAFQNLKKTRGLLQDPATFAEAVSQVRSWAATDGDTAKPEDKRAQSPKEQGESDVETIERLLGKPASREQAGTSGSVNMESLIHKIVKPYIVPAPDPQQAEIIAQVDRALGNQMRTILHHPDFQELEAAWRMLHFLVSHVETDEALRIYAIDVTKAELAADLVSAGALQSTGAYRLLVEQSVGMPGAEPYAVLVGAYTFDETVDDIKLLRQLGQLAQAAGAPFLTAAHSHFAGCESIAATPDPDDWRWQVHASAIPLWQELRHSPEAAYIGLVLPRFLLRLPYGKDTDPIEQFDFEEFSPFAGHEQYLWGNSAALCACLLAGAFREFGWSLTNGLRCDLAGIPMHIYQSDGEKHVTPCAETILTEPAMEILIGKGLMPVVSIKGRDAIRVPRFQSIAEPPAPLTGPWH